MLYLAVIVFRGSALVLRFRMLCYKAFFLIMKIKIYHVHCSWDFPPTLQRVLDQEGHYEGIQICKSGRVKVVHKFARQSCTRGVYF